MVDLEERLRATLRRQAAGVPPRVEVPPGLIRRAGLRIVRNLSAAAVVITVVAVTGVSVLNRSSGQTPAGLPSPEACSGSQLAGTAKLDSIERAMDGWLVVTNTGNASCVLRGTPIIRIRDHQGIPLDLRGVGIDPFWKTRGGGPPPGWPVVTLQPGASAGVHVQWTNWCGQKNELTWVIGLAGSGGSFSFPVDVEHDVPRCTGAMPSTLKVGPFEPYTPHT